MSPGVCRSCSDVLNTRSSTLPPSPAVSCRLSTSTTTCTTCLNVLPQTTIHSKFFSDRLCRWTAAPVVFSLPVIGKLMKAMGTIPASSKNIARALDEDQDVGVVLDGIAGMFSATSNDHETAFLSQRKQICAIALKQGDCQIVPVYWYGHSALWKTIVDPFGILETLSVKSNVSLVPFVGRWWWPLGPAKRVPVLIAFGEPVVFPANPEHTKPSKEVSHIPLHSHGLMRARVNNNDDKCATSISDSPDQNPPSGNNQAVGEYHAKMINEFRNVFDTHKAAYGWPNKRLVVV